MENSINFAYIHSVESFGTVDGPGIRFVIFMQGCPLKCKYCHNRDTWDRSLGKQVNLNDLFKEILKYKTYMDNSGGGITVSGGEPLLQAEFIINLFKKAKSKNISTCLDTAGSLKITPKIKELLSLTDLVLLDIKHINNEKCIDLTGSSNENNLNFARYLSNNNIPTWIRQVIIPGITDDEADLLNLKEFISKLKNVEKVELLPYHDMGKVKWENLGIKYPLENVEPCSTEVLNRAKKILGV